MAGRTRWAVVLFALVGAQAPSATDAADGDEHLSRRTRPGTEVLVRGFAEFDGRCRLRHVQTIVVAEPPTSGRIETRPGEVTIGDNWVGDRNCQGTKLAGVRVWYVPDADYTGPDHFAFDVIYQNHRKVRAVVDVDVR